ncbi:hypothetical protein HOS87_gp08 [Pseudomonas phage phiNV3]|uniref:Uncharacterized protein n=1 Tax=Pseudomonas phage phiNV3 TaxID=2079544 RepID=A0A2P0ZLI5_9CAUD|nr:hypothetical protein [Pseudomonas tolaasii]YP_009798988.1 hypothetical protein HOS87_gp08 [Pseudomonas phage phiNV3]ARB30325.1 hypothetical protein B5P22_24565 [Pseudomonas tolaasii]AVH86118.1 hypothetical protein phiNV3_p08 [Pseudomonas phage phiNV3]
MNIKHNTRKQGLAFHELVSGQLYTRIDMQAGRPRVYFTVADRPAHAGGTVPAENLVNMETGCLVGRVCASARFRHLPDATLDTGE